MDACANNFGPIGGSVVVIDPCVDNPGPIDKSVLYDQEKHISSAVWEGQERGALRCHEHTSKLGEWQLTKRQIELVDEAGFRYLRQIPSISLDNPLISALVERWRTETNTFHLTVGEMTITLKDVALLLGLPVEGEPVLGVTYTSCSKVCERFLGKVPESGYTSGGMVKLSWLKEFFCVCPEDAPTEDVECHTRAYLLYLMGSTIFSTTTGNKVPVMYLPLLEDFDKAGKYAWGAAALAFLYRSLGKASLKSQSTISGCLTLLQCWSYYHLNIGRPKLKDDSARDLFPLVLRWKGKQNAVTVKSDIVFYRNALNSLKTCDVDWLPYEYVDSMVIPESIQSILILGRSNTMLICFDKAERHLPDRCLRQHGMLQVIPQDVQPWERKSRGVDSGVDLSGKMEAEINEWSNRWLNLVEGDDGVDESEYMQWYLKITRKFVGRPTPLSSQYPSTVRFRTKKKRMSAGLRDIACIADTFSVKGLNPQQIESISRIRDTAHYCLGDQDGVVVNLSSTSQIEYEKRLEGKGSIMRKSSGKCKQKDDMSQFSDATSEGDQLKSYHADSDYDCQTESGKRVRKKERIRRKPTGKCKKDDSMQCYATIKEVQSQSCSAPNKNYQIQLCHDDFKQSQPQHLESSINASELYLEDGEDVNVLQSPGDSKVEPSLPCQAAWKGNDAQLEAKMVNDILSAQQCHADLKTDVSEQCQEAGESDDVEPFLGGRTADEDMKMQLYHADSKVDQLQPCKAGGDGDSMQICHAVNEVDV